MYSHVCFLLCSFQCSYHPPSSPWKLRSVFKITVAQVTKTGEGRNSSKQQLKSALRWLWASPMHVALLDCAHTRSIPHTRSIIVGKSCAYWLSQCIVQCHAYCELWHSWQLTLSFLELFQLGLCKTDRVSCSCKQSCFHVYKPLHGDMTCIKMVRVVSKVRMHSTELGINFLQMHCDQWYHQKSHIHL